MVRKRKLAVAVAFALCTAAPFAVQTARAGNTLSDYEVVENLSAEDDSAYKTVSAPCPPGKTAIGGGAGVFWTASPKPKLISSFQFGDGWYAEGESSDGQVWQLWVHSNCAVITP